jgi:gliding motility-associated-like protein
MRLLKASFEIDRFSKRHIKLFCKTLKIKTRILKMRNLLTIFFIIVSYSTTLAQLEGSNWYFGTYAGLEFSTGNPLPTFDGQLSTYEGCASVSDKAGNLLFYTDGSFVYDRNHNVMPNGAGLFGNPSSTQSAVVCPKPGTWNAAVGYFDGYVICTMDFMGGSNGVRWSEVDMTANAGSGAVVAATKNTLLIGTTTVESANFAKHENGCDYWLLTKEVGNNTWQVFPVTNAGVGNTPVTSNQGPVTINTWGTIKATPNSDIVAHSNRDAGVSVYDFDKLTGQLTYRYEDYIGNHYSLEFSPNSRFLYYTCLSNPNIYQLDLNTATQADFTASKVNIGATANVSHGYRLGSLQLGPDGKIYLALVGSTFLGAINNPDLLGVASNYTDNAVNIAGTNLNGSGTSVHLGLPSFPNFFLQTPKYIVYNQLCNSLDGTFSLSNYEDLYGQYWFVTPAGNTFNNTPGSSDSTYQVTLTAGSYDVMTVLDYGCYYDTITQTIEVISPATAVNLGNDTCFVSDFTLDAGIGYDFYEWQDSTINQTYNVTEYGTYFCEVGTIGSDLVYNGDFEEGNIGFNSDYNYGTNATTQGGYVVGTDVTNAWWANCPDHTSGTGNMIIADAACGTNGVPGGSDLWCQTIQVQPNTDYIFSAWMANANASNSYAQLGFYFNGVMAGNTQTSSATSCNWTQYYQVWNSGNLTSVDICLKELTLICAVADFIVDDISFSPICYQTDTINVYPTPQASFVSDTVCADLQSSFVDSSTTATGTITGWDWDFENDGLVDGNTQNPTNIYSSHGVYSANLLVTNSHGCTHDTTISVEVFPNPVSEFVVEDVCLNDSSEFLNNSSIDYGQILSYEWNLDDGTILNDTNVQHLYTAAGTYDVNLSVTSLEGCISDTTISTTVFNLPVADFDFTNACYLDSVAFENTSQLNGTTLNNIMWDVESDNIIDYTGVDGEHMYASSGTYDITQIVETTDGCLDTVSQEIIVYAKPTADWNYTTVCEYIATDFTNNSTVVVVDNDAITNHEWNFGDGNTSIIENPTHQYSSENVYSVELIVTTNHGCKDTLEQNVTVWPLPEVDFSPTDVCLGFATEFTDESTISNDFTTNSNIQWNWDFGDGGVMTTQNPNYTYQTAGVFNATLTVTSNNGCINDTTLSVTVNPNPEANFVGLNLEGCSPICPEIVSTSSIASPSSIAEFEWRLENTVVQNGPSGSYGECIENNSGSTDSYDLELKVTSSEGCVDTFMEPDFIKVFHNPIANFNFTPVEPDVMNTEVSFLNSTAFADLYDWDFYFVGSSTLINPIIDFPAEADDYDVRLVATTDEGCSDTTRAIVTIKDRIVFYVPNTFTPDGDATNNTFQPIFTSGFEPRDINLLIFNRWGEIVYESNNIDEGWDGNYQNQAVPEGTYIWKIEFTETMSDKRHIETGHVNVLR